MARRNRKPRIPPRPTAAGRRARHRLWARWFRTVKDQIYDLGHRRAVYREVRAMIDANPALQVPSAFYEWMQNAYIVDMTMAIRRLVDWDKRSISFVQLME